MSAGHLTLNIVVKHATFACATSAHTSAQGAARRFWSLLTTGVIQMLMTHWNRSRRCWSVKEGESPVWHAKDMTLFDVTFRVREGGRQRCLREHRRNVHAFACGQFLGRGEDDLVESLGMVQVVYNPYRAGHFTILHTQQPIYRARWVMLLADGTVWATTEGPENAKSVLARRK